MRRRWPIMFLGPAAALFNSTGFPKEPPYGLLDQLIESAIREIKSWPRGD